MIIPNPDCQAGKHRACNGTGWDAAADELATCTCACHREPGAYGLHGVASTETTIKCVCGVTITGGTTAAAFAALWEHEEAARAPITEADR